MVSKLLKEHRAPSDNFGGLRLIAAILVIFGHSYPLTGAQVTGYLGNPISTLAVKIFFVISGYLISESWTRDPDVIRYFWRRALRIFPGLVVLVALSVFIVGPVFSKLSLGEYFSANETWRYLDNIVLLPNYFLPGLFGGNVYPNAVNGSLWTLPVEFAMYIATPLVLVFFRSTFSIGAFAFFLSFVAVCFTRVWVPASVPVFWGTNLINALEMAPYFFWGAFYKKCEKNYNCFNLQISLVAIVILPLLAIDWAISEIIALIVVPYVTLSLGNAQLPRLGFLDRFGDLSYGTYLYGFLVQQIVAGLFPLSNHWSNFLISVVPSLFLAVLSWHLVEKRFLKLKPSSMERREMEKTAPA
ncbi:acyltransferase [Agrobacterium tumefaciens]|uniref:acyltransferase family protein n=1 Tax=Agrobacterium tumefaciens TaxID=358 RepID=UPI0015717BED|nr:acyltransferase [Agrobacterium tumefaciens]WCK16163.1 acyltransferase [Agrobacterium tumefaciens]